MGQDCPPRVHFGPAAELPHRDGEGDAGGGRQQPHLEAGEGDRGREGRAAPIQGICGMR